MFRLQLSGQLGMDGIGPKGGEMKTGMECSLLVK